MDTSRGCGADPREAAHARPRETGHCQEGGEPLGNGSRAGEPAALPKVLAGSPTPFTYPGGNTTSQGGKGHKNILPTDKMGKWINALNVQRAIANRCEHFKNRPRVRIRASQRPECKRPAREKALTLTPGQGKRGGSSSERSYFPLEK